jgi:hypothetical protein
MATCPNCSGEQTVKKSVKLGSQPEKHRGLARMQIKTGIGSSKDARSPKKTFLDFDYKYFFLFSITRMISY